MYIVITLMLLMGSTSVSRRLFQNLPSWSRHHGALWRSVLLLKLITHLLHRYPFDTLVLVDVFNYPAWKFSIETLTPLGCNGRE